MNVNNVKGRITSEVANIGNFRYYSKNLTGIHPCFTQKNPTIYLKKTKKQTVGKPRILNSPNNLMLTSSQYVSFNY